MIVFTSGNLLTADVEALVNPVNCVGVMGKGLALQLKQAYPENFRVYQRACKAGEVAPGRMLTVPTGRGAGPKYIVNFPTKRHRARALAPGGRRRRASGARRRGAAARPALPRGARARVWPRWPRLG